jgi:hypothetical protein
VSNLGMGVMIGRLGGNTESVAAYQSSLGKTIRRARLDGDLLCLDFTDGTGLRLHDEGQSCCESRYMRTDDDLNYYEGASLLEVEIADAPSINDGGEEHDVQFLNVKTSKGVFTMSNHVEHNGYYGGFAIVANTYQVQP